MVSGRVTVNEWDSAAFEELEWNRDVWASTLGEEDLKTCSARTRAYMVGRGYSACRTSQKGKIAVNASTGVLDADNRSNVGSLRLVLGTGY